MTFNLRKLALIWKIMILMMVMINQNHM